MKFMIIVLFCIKKTLSELCNINQSCSYCQYCFEVNKDYCSCSFYNFFCFNKTESIYSYNSSFLQEYDKCSLSKKKELKNNKCGKSDISKEINNKDFYQFFSFNNPEYLNENNLLCHYTINNENGKLKDDFLIEIEIDKKNPSKTITENDGKNLIIIFVKEISSSKPNFYEVNLSEIFDKKINVKIAQFKSISIYISLIKNNGFIKTGQIISLYLGAKTDSSKKDTLKNYRIALIVLCIVIFSCIGICIIIYLVKYRRNRPELYNLRAIQIQDNHNSRNNGIYQDEKKNKLEKLYKNQLKKRKYLKKENINETTACSICLEEFVENKSEVSITPCMHIFHYKCLYNWLFMENSKSLCPYCNYDLLSEKPPTKRHILNNNLKQKKNKDNLNSTERDIKNFKNNIIYNDKTDWLANVEENNIKNHDCNNIINNIGNNFEKKEENQNNITNNNKDENNNIIKINEENKNEDNNNMEKKSDGSNNIINNKENDKNKDKRIN